MNFIASFGAILAAVLVGIGAVLVGIGAIAGYIANIVFLIKVDAAAAVGQAAVSLIGVFLGPLGAMHGLGWLFGWW